MGYMYRGYYYEYVQESKEQPVVVEKPRKDIPRPLYKNNIEFGVYQPIKVEVGYVINENNDIVFTKPQLLLPDSTNTRPIYSRTFYHKMWGVFYPFVPGNLSEIREVTSTSNLKEEYCVYGFLNEDGDLIYYDHFAKEVDY
jgi:hypothetical protein